VSKLILFLSVLLPAVMFSACGNSDRGLIENRKPPAASAVNSASAHPGPQDTFSACQLMTINGGSNAAYAQTTFTGTHVCRGISRPNSALLQVNASFPANVSFCLVPIAADGTASAETCFNVNGQAEITLTTSNYSVLVLLAASDMSNYRAYLAQQTDNAPPRATATL
jgi:hypothetical protein